MHADLRGNTVTLLNHVAYKVDSHEVTQLLQYLDSCNVWDQLHEVIDYGVNKIIDHYGTSNLQSFLPSNTLHFGEICASFYNQESYNEFLHHVSDVVQHVDTHDLASDVFKPYVENFMDIITADLAHLDGTIHYVEKAVVETAVAAVVNGIQDEIYDSNAGYFESVESWVGV